MKNYVILITLFILSMLTIEVQAQCDSTNTFCRPNFSSDSVYRVFYLGHLNQDCYLDTVIASGSKKDCDTLKLKNKLFPKYIFWGRCKLPRDSARFCPCYDSLGVPDSIKVWYSKIVIPNFYNKRSYINFLRLNNDDVTDMMIFTGGKNGPDTNANDTSMVCAVFGQPAFDVLYEINLTNINSSQTQPFFAQKMVYNNQFVDSARRDYTGYLSYIIEPINVNVGYSANNNNQSSQAIVSGISHSENTDFKVFPNPARDALHVSYANTLSGEFSFEIITLSGRSLLQKKFYSTGDSQEGMVTIPLYEISSGSYYVKIMDSKGATLLMKEFIVIH